MKNIFKTLAAFAVIALAVACSKDGAEGPALQEEATVSFDVQLPGGLASRATNDGTTAQQLFYAVYSDIANDAAPLFTGETTINITATVSIDLVTDQVYDIVFWAQKEGKYTPDWNAKTIAMNYANGAAGADEERDAFLYVWHDLEVKGAVNEPVTLKRPFAQLNVGLTKDQITKAANAGFELESVKVTAQTHNSFSFAAAQGAPADELATIEFAASAFEAPVNADGKHEITVEGTAYDWVSFNYLLACTPSELTNVEIVFNGKNGKTIALPAFASVPVERNHRTNIVGDLLTDPANFNVTIDPVFDEEDYAPAATIDGTPYMSLADAFASVQAGQSATILLAQDMEMTPAEGVMVANGADITFDLNGKTINGEIPASTGVNQTLFSVDKGGKLTMKGSGAIEVNAGPTGNNLSTIINNMSGTVVIEGGEYRIRIDETQGSSLIVDVVDNNSTLGAATLIVKGGTFYSDKGVFRNFNNHRTEKNLMEIYDLVHEKGYIWNHDSGHPNGEIHVFYEGDYAYDKQNVFYGERIYFGLPVSNSNELAEQLAEGGKIVLTQDITLPAENANADYAAALEVNGETVTIDLNGKTLKAGNSDRQKLIVLLNGANATIKNGKLEIISTNGNADGTGTSTGGSSAVYCNGANITMEDVQIIGSQRGGHRAIEVYNGVGSFTNVTIDVNYGLGINAGAGAKATLKNCNITVNGMYSAPYNSTCFSVMGGGEMTVESGNYKLINDNLYSTGASHGGWVGIIMNSGGTLSLNGGTFTNVPAAGFMPQYERPLFTCDAVAGTEARMDFNGGTYSPQEDQIAHKGGSGGTETITFKGEILSGYSVNGALLEKMTDNGDGSWSIQ